MEIVSWIVAPFSVPVSAPRPVVGTPVTPIVTVPERSFPVCVTWRVIEPGPDESVAVPFHEPATFTAAADGADGVADVDEDEPPPQAAAKTRVAHAAAYGHR